MSTALVGDGIFKSTLVSAEREVAGLLLLQDGWHIFDAEFKTHIQFSNELAVHYSIASLEACDQSMRLALFAIY
eukprot:59048-Pelagomonas_calceolata.AAC.2